MSAIIDSLLGEKRSLELQLAEVTDELERSERQRKSAIDQFLAMRDERDKLKAEREQLEKQEPAVNVTNGVVTWSQVPDDFNGCLFFYAHPPVPDGKVLVDAETIASYMKKSYELGKVYWQQADSESYSQNRKADETQAKFDAMLKAAQGE